VADAKAQARRQWNRTPCGTRGVTRARHDRKFFEEVRDRRYRLDDPWIPRAVDFGAWRGKRVLEIGYGMGTDLAEFASKGARVSGVDLTPGHHDLARRHFAQRRLKGDLRLADAARLPYPEGRFDLVYSNGVLHHTPDTDKCFAEAYRVLKPGGTFWVALYHRFSAFHLLSKVLNDGLLEGNLRRLGYDGLMATLEHGADGVTVKPLVKTYGAGRLGRMLTAFRDVKVSVHHLRRDHFSVLARLVPEALVPRLEGRLGWYVVGTAVKPGGAAR